MLGECLCGDIQFFSEIRTDPFKIYQCHCSLCKKQSGSSSNSATIIEASHFKWLKHDTIKNWQKNTGFSSHFCTNCGCPVPNSFADKYYWIPVGLLEFDRNLVAVEVVANLCLNSKSSWHSIDTESNNFDTLPDFKAILQFSS
ncbi:MULTISPECIES: GFA family protein [unclassified Psychrobacter]|uniref:GFA family protein n=1 Tax=unclassified Psychrobacter TaxID=196806 RepID=UPI0025B56684|nr:MULTISPECIES: GFA family protein [unclassified Psychrobacter]MDN3452160.1 GFA family protein [Psychrobacter sp. APC 3350]MDN3501219.1 GFA family protein [Psychrobacter sp. 5A.1]